MREWQQKVTPFTKIKLVIYTVFIITSILSKGQNTQNGLHGMIAVPIAQAPVYSGIQLGIQTNSRNFKFYPSKFISTAKNNFGVWRSPANNEIIYFVSLNFIPRTNLILGVLRDIDKADTLFQGIGDRSLQISYLVLEESKFKPAIQISLVDPFFSVNAYQVTNHLIASKHILKSKNFKMITTLGIGTKKRLTLKRNSNQIKLELVNNRTSEYNFNYLVGLFGGVHLQYSKFLKASLEYDSHKVNFGIETSIFNKQLDLELNLLALKYPCFGIAYSTKLK